ncbi:platelet-activating factor acetylhydrolase [Nemania sp. FL0916]|nr:platelet-activating factor acetylhydrolase [Nemania sp. FL0916]
MILVPALTGPYKVGTSVLELVDYSRQDPFAPPTAPQPRDLVVSLFYPTEGDCPRGHSYPQKQNCTLAPQFPPTTAAGLDAITGHPGSGLAGSVTTRACNGSPLSRPDLPLLLMSPGLGNSRLFYSDMAEDLASHGWNVVTIDHTYEGVIVEFPDGRIITPADSPNAENATDEENLSIRVRDLRFVLDALSQPNITSRIPGLATPNKPHTPAPKLRTDKVGAWGHSFGGATALQLLHDDARFTAGADLDGGVYGDVVQQGTAKPFLYLRAENHTHESDPTWAEAWPHLRGFKREYGINDTLHGAFTDLPLLRDLLPAGALGMYGEGIGGIKGARIIKIESVFMDAFFSRFLKGKGGELLDGKGMDGFPEVTLENQDME